jgi:pyridoxine 5-phosphate synthase
VGACIAAGAPGVTVHPRADRRHITPDDVRQIAAALSKQSRRVEFNIEGDPRPELLALVEEIRPDQCTLVPVAPGEVTSQAGWKPGIQTERLAEVVSAFRSQGVRISVFVDARPESIRWAASVGADRVELYTEPFARSFEAGEGSGRRSCVTLAEAANLAHSLGLGINAGHDLDLENLLMFRALPHLDEVSIGHAIISRAVFVGLDTVVREYLDVLAGT